MLLRNNLHLTRTVVYRRGTDEKEVQATSCAIADAFAWQDDRAHADQHITADRDVARQDRAGGHMRKFADEAIVLDHR